VKPSCGADEGEGRHAQPNPVVMPNEEIFAALISVITDIRGHINNLYSQVHDIEILKSDSAWMEEVDDKLLLAGTAGASSLH
jgi:hypothetical protein